MSSTTTTAAPPVDRHEPAASPADAPLVRGQLVQVLSSAPYSAGKLGGLAVVSAVGPARVKLRRLYDDEVLYVEPRHLRDVEVRCGLAAGFTAAMHNWPEASPPQRGR